MADLDEVQSLGETAIKTLTQLWRQLPRLDSEASKKLGDEVADARKAVERLVRIGCETHLNIPLGGSNDNQTKLYEPLPFGHHQRSQRSGPHTSPTRSDSSVSRVKPAFPQQPPKLGNNNEIELDDELSASSNNFGDPNEETKIQQGSNIKQASAGSPGAKSDNNSNNNNSFLDEAAIAADYERFRRDLNLPPGLNYYDDPAWIEMMKSYQSLTGTMKLPPSRLSLMVQLAMRRELMWRLHARMLQMQSDRDSLAELETKARCDIDIRSTEHREELVAEMQGIKLSGDSDSGNSEKRMKVFENIRKSFEREKEMREMLERCDKMDEEKAKLAGEVSKLTKEVMKLAKDNTQLTKKAANPSQALHPDQLKTIMEEITRLRGQVEDQEAELQALGV